MKYALKEFMKCRLDNFSMGFRLFYGNLSICENKKNSHEYAVIFLKAPYNHFIKKLNICNIPPLESEEYDI